LVIAAYDDYLEVTGAFLAEWDSSFAFSCRWYEFECSCLELQGLLHLSFRVSNAGSATKSNTISTSCFQQT